MGMRGRETQDTGSQDWHLLPPPERRVPRRTASNGEGGGALDTSRVRVTGRKASRAAPFPGPTAEQGAREAMADLETREAMVDLPPRPRPQPPPLQLEPYYPPPQKILRGAYRTERGIRSPPWAQRGTRSPSWAELGDQEPFLGWTASEHNSVSTSSAN